ncbi:hypothetical protein EK904_001507 [Melospiza melodia maxima]|nr:hypothetical protein EK904_001507 [Melospiza melodia maxima]
MDNNIFQLIMDLDHKKQQDCKPILFINLCVNRRIAFEINAYKLTLQHANWTFLICSCVQMRDAIFIPSSVITVPVCLKYLSRCGVRGQMTNVLWKPVFHLSPFSGGHHRVIIYFFIWIESGMFPLPGNPLCPSLPAFQPSVLFCFCSGSCSLLLGNPFLRCREQKVCWFYFTQRFSGSASSSFMTVVEAEVPQLPTWFLLTKGYSIPDESTLCSAPPGTPNPVIVLCLHITRDVSKVCYIRLLFQYRGASDGGCKFYFICIFVNLKHGSAAGYGNILNAEEKKKKKKYTTQTKEKIPLHSTVQHAKARTAKSHL